MFVLVYGTLRQGEGNHGVMERSGGVYCDTIRVPGVQLWTLHGGFPGAVYTGDDSDVAVCELYRVQTMDNLDRLEGYYEDHPENGLYNRMQLLLSEEYPDTKAWLYTYNGSIYGDKIEDWKAYE